MANLGHGVLKGRKTYLAAGLGVIGFVGAYLAGDIGLADALQGVLTAILGATIRHGVKTELEE